MKLITREFLEQKEYFGTLQALKYLLLKAVWPFEKTFRFLYKVFQYSKLLWNDYDFDYSSLLRLMKFKLERMAILFEKDGHTIDAPDRAKEMKQAAFLIGRILDDNYWEIPMKKLEAQYGELEWSSEATDNPHTARLIIERTRAKRGSLEYEKERAASDRIFKAAEQQKKQDYEYLFQLMNKRIQWWWD